MNKEIKNLIGPSSQEICLEMQDLILDGWEIDESNPLVLAGWQWQVTMIKTDLTYMRLKQRLQDVIDGKPKLTRAQILEKARAARKPSRGSAEEE